MALVDQHAIADTLDEDLRGEDLCVRELSTFKDGSNQESGGLWRGLDAKGLLVDLAEGRHSKFVLILKLLAHLELYHLFIHLLDLFLSWLHTE